MIRKDFTNKKLDRLLVIEDRLEKVNGKPFVKAKCDCGTIIFVNKSNVTSGKQKSCGCLNKENRNNSLLRFRTHNKTNTKVYKAWANMLWRCKNTTHRMAKHYSLKGIKVCKEWKSFEKFYKDMGEPPTQKHSIDRIDNNKGYSKENCRWATQIEQNRNRNINIKFMGKTASESSYKLGSKDKNLVSKRIKNGWSLKKAFTTPVRIPKFNINIVQASKLLNIPETTLRRKLAYDYQGLYNQLIQLQKKGRIILK